MKNLTLTLLLLAFLPLIATAQTVWNGTADTTWYTSDTSATEFTITTAEQLAGLAQLVNGSENNGTYNMSGKTIKLGANIMLNDTTNWQNWGTTAPANTWIAIGTSNKSFSGTFDGEEHIISGVYINNTINNQGLFGYLSSGGTIKNVGVVASYIKGDWYVGGLVGYNYGGKVSNSYYTSKVSGTGSSVGGLVGINNGTISNSYSTGAVNGESGVGGLVGYNFYGTISNSYSTGAVSGSSYIGGLVGVNDGTSTVNNSYSTGAVSGTGDYLGGLVGNNEGTISNGYYDKQTSVRTDAGRGEGKTTAEMKLQSTYKNWDFINVWGIKNNGYPYLRALPEPEVVFMVIKTQPSNLTYTHGDSLDLSGLVATLIYSNATTKDIAFADFADSITTNLANGAVLDYASHNAKPIELVFANNGAIKANTNNLIVAEIQTPIIPQIAAAGKIQVQTISNTIQLSNLPSNSKVEVYNLRGEHIYVSNRGNPRILRHQAQRLNSQRLVIGVPTKGMYVVKASFGSEKQVMRVVVR